MKTFWVVKSKTILAVVAMVIVAGLLSISYAGGASALVFLGSSSRKVPIYSVDTSSKQVALSFDAAWGSDQTQELIDLLKEKGVSATFFLVGFWVDKYPELVTAIDEAGMEIGTHSNTHPDMVKKSSSECTEELSLSMQKITAITGKQVTLFRPPFGSYNNTVISAAEALGLTSVQWSVDSLDWQGGSSEEIASRVIKKATSGSIILMHNNAENVVEAAEMIIDNLLARGYTITSVGQLIYSSNYYIDSCGVQHSKD